MESYKLEIDHQGTAPITININLNKNEYFREYYKNNNELIACECGMQIKKRGKCKHILSQHHKMLLEIRKFENLMNQRNV